MTRTDPDVLETDTGPQTLDDIQRALDALWLAHDEVPHTVRMHVAIAAAEVGANIIEHAGAGSPVHMRMECWVRPDSVLIAFTDNGIEVDVDLETVCLPDELAERSRGLALTKSVLREFTYQRVGTSNRWTLVSERFG